MTSLFNATDFRAAASEFATGVTIVTTLRAGQPVGMTVNSFASVSLEPPLVVWNVGRDSDSYRAFVDAETFAISVLGASQKPLAVRFATRGIDRFAATPWRPGLDGLPLIEQCLTCFECRTVHRYPGGDHMILVGEVLDIHARTDEEPLLFHRGKLVTRLAAAQSLEPAK